MIIPVIVLCVLFLIIFSIFWIIHRSMTIDHTDTWDYGTLKQFKAKFKELGPWTHDGWPHSYFNRSNRSQIHAGINQFNEKGMVIYPWYWIQSIIFLKMHPIYRRKTTRKKGLWQ